MGVGQGIKKHKGEENVSALFVCQGMREYVCVCSDCVCGGVRRMNGGTWLMRDTWQ